MKRTILILGLVMMANTGFSQNDSLPKLTPYFSALIVSDMEASITWYSENFGFEVMNQVSSETKKFKIANLKREGALLELIELDSAITAKELLKDQPQGARLQGIFKIGFSVVDFDTWVARLKATGVEFQGDVVIDKTSGKKMLIVKDPDGNRIQLFEA